MRSLRGNLDRDFCVFLFRCSPEWIILSNILWIEMGCGSRKLLVGGGIMVPLCLVKEMPGVNQLLMIWERLLRNFYGDTMVVVEEGLYQFLLMVT